MDVFGIYLDSMHSERPVEIYHELCLNMKTLNADDYSILRDHVIICLHLGNELRLAQIAQFKLKEVQNNCKIEGKGTFNIEEKKTSHGPCQVILLEEEFQLLAMYIEIRMAELFFRECFCFLDWK